MSNQQAGDVSIRGFQRLIRDRYYETDARRGVAGTFLLLTEEFGELATALHNHTRPLRTPGGETTPEELANLEEEFADVLAWLCTLANITGVDLTEAVRKYTEEGRVEGVKD